VSKNGAVSDLSGGGGEAKEEKMRIPKTPIPGNVRQAVFERDSYTCRYCGDKHGPFQADHVYPESRGGETTISNLVTACQKCNNKKHSKVGMWPKPIGYFGEREEITREATDELKRNGAQILIALLTSGFLVSTMGWFPNDHGFIIIKVAACIWLGVSVLFAGQWVRDTLRS
jgi:hypothetical protein